MGDLLVYCESDTDDFSNISKNFYVIDICTVKSFVTDSVILHAAVLNDAIGNYHIAVYCDYGIFSMHGIPVVGNQQYIALGVMRKIVQARNTDAKKDFMVELITDLSDVHYFIVVCQF